MMVCPICPPETGHAPPRRHISWFPLTGHSRRCVPRVLCCLIACATVGSALAEEKPAATPAASPAPNNQAASAPAGQDEAKPRAEEAQNKDKPDGKEKEKPAPYTSRAWGVRLEPEPPAYAKPLNKFEIPGTEGVDWLDFGLQHRTRFELRRDDYRRNHFPAHPDENQFLLRSQLYVGIRKVLDPLRLGIEAYDARQYDSDFPESNEDVDALDIIQGFGELYFEDALGKGYPIQFRFGRMTFDYLDRRLLARNRWRNTISSFDGFRLRLGQPKSDWQFDVIAAQPVERRLVSRNVNDEERWLYAMIGSWRKWSPWIVLEPYYFILDEDFKDIDAVDRTLHTMGLYTFGLLGKSGFDYDLDITFQFGDETGRDICAFAYHSDVGYTFTTPWKPRLSFASAWASGDRVPDDRKDERFDRLFEVAHSLSSSDYFESRNLIKEQIRLEIRPTEKMRLTGAYGGYWLASDSDAWTRIGRRDPTGRSRDFIGQEFDLQWRWQIDPRVELELGYIAFLPGPFVQNTGPADDSDFFYVQTTIQF